MQPKQSEGIDLDDLVPAGASDTNKRVAEFRNRKASAGHERLEIYTTKLVKEQVREFAEAKALTRGVAAEVLLQRGIEAHITETQSLAASNRLNGPSLPVAAEAVPQPIASEPIHGLSQLFRERVLQSKQPPALHTPEVHTFVKATDHQTKRESADLKPETVQKKEIKTLADHFREAVFKLP